VDFLSTGINQSIKEVVVHLNCSLMRIISFILILASTFISCDFSTQEKEIRMYGTAQKMNDSLFVPLRLSDFENFGKLIDRISTIACNDSVPQIVIEDEQSQRLIFPVFDCTPPPFDPKSKHYATIRSGKAYRRSSLDPINLDSLGTIIQQDYMNKRSSFIKGYLAIVEADYEENTLGIRNYLLQLTKGFDEIESNQSLNIILWTIVEPPPIPPPPPYVLEN